MDLEARVLFGSYVAARSPALLRTAYLLTGGHAEAEDLLQTTWIRTYLAWDRIRDRGAVDGYVRRVMVNASTSSWRRRRIQESMCAIVPEGPPSRDRTADSDLHDVLWSALARMPRRQRTALVLRFYEDLTEAETAHVMAVSIGTVKSTTSRALALLRQDPSLRDDPRLSLPDGALT